MPILQTLSHKASRSRLRKRSTVSLRGDARDQAASAGDEKRTDRTPPLPCPQCTEYITEQTNSHLSPEPSTFSPGSPASSAGSSPMESFMFWRKRDPSPARSAHSRTPSGERNPKPILRRRLSKSSAEDHQATVHQPQAVRFPSSPCATRTSVMQGYNPPPSSFARPHPQAQTPSPQQSPVITHTTNRASSLPPTPPGGFPFPNQTPPTQGRAMSHHTPSPQHSSPAPGSRNSTMSRASIVSRSSYASASYNSPASTNSQLPPAPQTVVPVTPPAQVSVGVQPSAPVVPARSVNRRSSRPISNAGSMQAASSRSSGSPSVVRPSSVMSGNSTMSRGRRSSRPQAPSASRTRMSIASVSTYASSSNGHGSGSPGRLSPVTTPTPPSESFTASSSSNNGHYVPSHQPPSVVTKRASGSFNGNGKAGAFAFPSASPTTPTTPPKRQTTLIPPGAGTPTFGGESMPMFNVIPATPQQGGEAEEFESAPVEQAEIGVARRSRSASPSIRTLEDMPEEEEEEEYSVTPRHLSFDGSAFKHSPRLDDAIQLDRSPIVLELTQLDDIEGGLDSDGETEDSHEARTADEHVQTLEPAVEEPIVDASANASAPPPRLPKSPMRQEASLYQSPHDDGRSISRSLAELAALACDLPPLGAELTQQATEAAQRLAAARFAADSAASVSAELSRKSAPAPPSRPLPAPPVHVEEEPAVEETPEEPMSEEPEFEDCMAKSSADVTSPIWVPHHTAQVPSDPLPPSPPFMSYGSLPSLMSNGSMPSSASESMSVPSSLSHSSIMSAPASPDAEAALGSLLRQLSITDAAGILHASHALSAAARAPSPTTPKQSLTDLPATAKLYGGLGLGLDVNSLQPSAFEVTPTNEKPSFALPSPRANRMSLVPAAHREAFYGTPEVLIEGQRASFASADSVSTGYTAATHTPHGSISSMSMSSDYEESVLHHAEIVEVKPYSQAYVVGRDDARTHEVGIAF